MQPENHAKPARCAEVGYSAGMARQGLAATLSVGLVALVAAACSAEEIVEKTPVDAFCEAMGGVAAKCQGGCEDTLRRDCGGVAENLTQAAMQRATDCFLSGRCADVCLSKALVDLPRTSAKDAIRDAYCGTCAKGQSDCQASFFSPQTPSSQGGPGAPLLPYADTASSRVVAECASVEGCQLGFSACALDATKRGMQRLSSESAECLVRGLFEEGETKRAPDGGAIVVTCTPGNCPGCCRDDLCLAGTGKDACGKGGGTCETCSGTATCEASACKVPCGPDTCAGCCAGNTCVEGNEKAACGKAGLACTACGSSFVCSEGSCVDTSCKATCAGCCAGSTCLGGTSGSACGKAGNACVDCGKGRTCSATGCALDTNALFDVVLQSAVVPVLNKQGAAWDPFGGLPDPYGKAFSSLGAASHSGTTRLLTDTAAPQWAETILRDVPARELLNSFSLELWDDDYDSDDVIGGCAVRLDAAMFDGSLRTARCAATPSGVELQVTFRLVAK